MSVADIFFNKNSVLQQNHYRLPVDYRVHIRNSINSITNLILNRSEAQQINAYTQQTPIMQCNKPKKTKTVKCKVGTRDTRVWSREHMTPRRYFALITWYWYQRNENNSQFLIRLTTQGSLYIRVRLSCDVAVNFVSLEKVI